MLFEYHVIAKLLIQLENHSLENSIRIGFLTNLFLSILGIIVKIYDFPAKYKYKTLERRTDGQKDQRDDVHPPEESSKVRQTEQFFFSVF